MRLYASVFLIAFMAAVGILSLFRSPEGNTVFKARGKKHFINKSEVLIFGGEEYLPVLDRAGIFTDFLPRYDENANFKGYRYILALSSDDNVNTQLAVAARYKNHDATIIIRCNDSIYVEVLQRFGFTQILSKNVSGEELLALLSDAERILN